MMGSAFQYVISGNQPTFRSSYYKSRMRQGKSFITYVWVTGLWEGFHLTSIKLRFHFTWTTGTYMTFKSITFFDISWKASKNLYSCYLQESL